jgi:hypothetical protein
VLYGRSSFPCFRWRQRALTPSINQTKSEHEFDYDFGAKEEGRIASKGDKLGIALSFEQIPPGAIATSLSGSQSISKKLQYLHRRSPLASPQSPLVHPIVLELVLVLVLGIKIEPFE